MRTFTKLLLAGAGAAAVAGASMAADRGHVLNVALPDGSIAQVHYTGDVAPQVVVAPQAVPVALVAGDPFAMFDRISLAMDRQMDAMLSQAALLAQAAPAGGQVSEAALRSLPPGTVSYSYTSYWSGNGAQCSQSVQVTSLGANQAPKVIKQSAGDCNAMNRQGPTPAVQQAKPAAPKVTPVVLHQEKAPEAKGPII
ncbi:hypothetical protein [Sphingomonas crusticola]|uniref:hypothetical protein n=1 Tax=Sphingomonas crusticola TaxID=1697973 RepID=UPI000E285EDA|nr:hypothetical protein [Sphingomonas crusticola]